MGHYFGNASVDCASRLDAAAEAEKAPRWHLASEAAETAKVPSVARYLKSDGDD